MFTGLIFCPLTGYNPGLLPASLLDTTPPRGNLYIIGLTDSPLCKRCEAEEETSAHVSCECQAIETLRNTCLGSFYLDPEDIQSLSYGQSETIEGTGFP